MLAAIFSRAVCATRSAATVPNVPAPDDWSAVTRRHQSNQLPWAGFLAAGWGAIGATIGASQGFFDREEALVYVATNVTAGKVSS